MVLASEMTVNGRFRSGIVSTGALESAAFIASKAPCSAAAQVQDEVPFVRATKGATVAEYP